MREVDECWWITQPPAPATHCTRCFDLPPHVCSFYYLFSETRSSSCSQMPPRVFFLSSQAHTTQRAHLCSHTHLCCSTAESDMETPPPPSDAAAPPSSDAAAPPPSDAAAPPSSDAADGAKQRATAVNDVHKAHPRVYTPYVVFQPIQPGATPVPAVTVKVRGSGCIFRRHLALGNLTQREMCVCVCVYVCGCGCGV